MDEVKKILRIGTNNAYEMVAQKKIPSIKLGNKIRVPKKVLMEWIKKETAKKG
ncbi:MAG: helix-turn-helix domain-containing protein [Ignavibacteriales bacterium]